MSLLVLMYHRARAGPRGNAPAALESHFAHVARHHPCVLPGQPLAAGRLNVCLTFDDAYFDFHQVVFPLLEKYSLRALLAVAPALCGETAETAPEIRLAQPDLGLQTPEGTAGLCTWLELRELAASGRVELAAHGLNHVRLDDPSADLAREVVEPKRVLAARLGVTADSFVFPYGRFSPRALALARMHYRHTFRIGQASNRDWSQPLLYRVSADNLADAAAPFATGRLQAYRIKAWWNRLRQK